MAVGPADAARPFAASYTVSDSWGLSRCERAVLRALAVEGEIVGHIAGIVESAAREIVAAGTAEERRAAVTLLRVAGEQLSATTRTIAEHTVALHAVVELLAVARADDDPKARISTGIAGPTSARRNPVNIS